MNTDSKKKRHWRSLCAILLLLITFTVTGCVPQVFVAMPTAGKSVRSHDGVMVTVPNRPQRILALSSAYDCILLGLVPTQRLAGVSKLSTYSEYSLEWKKSREVPTTFNSYTFEAVMNVHPDLVIATEYTSKDVINALRSVGIPTVVVRSQKTVTGTMETIKDLAAIVGEEAKGQAQVQRIEEQLQWIQERAQQIPKEDRKRVFFASSMDGYTGKGSLFDDMCHYMGMYNAPVAVGYPTRTSLTDERILVMNPDYILIPVYENMYKTLRSRYTESEALAPVQAVKDGNVIPVKAAYLYTGNQHIGDSMIAIMKVVYPAYMK